MIKSLSALLKKFAAWMQTEIPVGRVSENDATGRTWFLSSLEYDKTLLPKDIREYVDRKDLNKEFVKRYLNMDVKSAKGVSSIKVEISALYSFSKCFSQRYKSRIQYYRDDLSQKGARNMAACGQAQALFEAFDKNMT